MVECDLKTLNKDEITMMSTLYYTNTYSWIYFNSTSKLRKKQSAGRHAQTHYPESWLTSIYTLSLTDTKMQNCNKCQFSSIRIDTTWARTHDLPLDIIRLVRLLTSRHHFKTH